MSYISTSALQKMQNRLSLNLVEYDLATQWNSHQYIGELRKKIHAYMPSGLFDPQDLEHQTLFRLTTYDPSEITEEVIRECIDEQHHVIQQRLASVANDLPYIFRGFNPQSKDLNISKRLELKNNNGTLIASGYGRSFEVEFKKIQDTSIIELFTEKLHYIHSARHRGDAFGFFFKGDDMPWGVETAEPSIIARQYKRDALLAHGIDPNKAIEITRLYLLPGSPKNAISIMDGLVARHYKDHGLEAMYTTTMPTYAKTKGATTAGGMKDVLLVKELSHTFSEKTVAGKKCYVHEVHTDSVSNGKKLQTHSKFPTLYTVETYMRLNRNRDVEPVQRIKDKVIYINEGQRKSSIDHEAKFHITNINDCLKRLQAISKYSETIHINDQFWGESDKEKLRLREVCAQGAFSYEVSRKYRISKEPHIRTQINEVLYLGKDKDSALNTIKYEGKYLAENSLEKIRMIYVAPQVRFGLDIYPFGAYLEVLGHINDVWTSAGALGFKKEDSITLTADETYVKWAAERNYDELWHVKFGLASETSSRE